MNDVDKKQKQPARRNYRGIDVWLFPEEKAYIKENAQKAGLSMSEYLRRLGMNTKISPRIDVELGREILKQAGVLGKLGGLLKMLLENRERFKGARGVELQKQTQSLLNEMQDAKTKLMNFVVQ